MKMKSPLKNLIIVLACLALGAGLFGVGYWQGKNTQRSEALAANGR